MPTNQDEKHPDYPNPSGDFINYPGPGTEGKNIGYETTDVNARGIVVFIGGLFGFVVIFFFFCYGMGKLINNGLNAQDGPTDKWHQKNTIFAGAKVNGGGKREDLKSNAAIQQQELQAMTTAFPGPRLQTDDGNQDTADLHAREDLLLDNYSSVPGQPLRIPISRAMEIIASKGLPVSAAAQPAQQFASDEQPTVQVPLTNGFARTGYELDQIEARHQRLEYGKAEGTAEHAELKPIR